MEDVKSGLGTRLQSKWGGSYIILRVMLCILIFRSSIVWTGVRGKSVSQAIDNIVSYTIYGLAMCPGGTRFPRKFCPTGQYILSAPRIICPGLGRKSVWA